MNHEMNKLIASIQLMDSKKDDIIADAVNIAYDGGRYVFDDEPITVTRTAESQLCRQAGIPVDFFRERMLPVEKSVLFNRLNTQLAGEDRMFRFSGNTLYGVVSPRYKKIDNNRILDIIESAEDAGIGLKPVKFRLDHDHTKVKLVPEEVHVGELAPMIEITNSENGLGSLQVYAGVFRWVCSNGLMVPVGNITRSRWMHLGNSDITLPDLGIVLNRSMEYLERLDNARTLYLSLSEKSRIITGVAKALGHKVANRVVRVANRDYHSGRSMFDAVNAITRTAQAYNPSQQTEIEKYASTLLAA